MAVVRNVLSFLVNRLSVPNLIVQNRSITTNINFPLFFRTSLPMLAEPLKKKKKTDPAILRAREERKKRRIEKFIRKLEKNAKELKPIEEIGFFLSLNREQKSRARKEKLSLEDEENHKALLKSWAQYKYSQHLSETKMIDRIMSSQQKALEQLKSVSEDLYLEAIQIDLSLVPFKANGPTRTPPIQNYETPDGDFLDVSPKWQ